MKKVISKCLQHYTTTLAEKHHIKRFIERYLYNSIIFSLRLFSSMRVGKRRRWPSNLSGE